MFPQSSFGLSLGPGCGERRTAACPTAARTAPPRRDVMLALGAGRVEVESMTTKNPVKPSGASKRRAARVAAQSAATRRSSASSAVHTLVAALRRAMNKVEDVRDVVLGDEGEEHRGAWTLHVKLESDPVDGGFVAECPDVPGAVAQGETEREAIENLIDAINGVLEVKVERFFESVEFEAPGRAQYTVPM